ncbi:hypothetical protein [Xylella fastidiosa]|uniref:hypothetical protein n=1 Tax=Xylella fastidiosa TaxID=2371 RepID=UPI002417A13D|nr:hypothetical protein [Xylella fastidiosa]MDG4872837.1 hypothetical protein [Xylella fastidiosa subsp. multiplex]
MIRWRIRQVIESLGEWPHRNKAPAGQIRYAAPQHVVDTLQNLQAGLGDQRDKM